MKAIWKYPVKSRAEMVIERDAKILSVGVQDGEIYLWALVDPEAEYAVREIVVYGTGDDVPDDPGTFLGTVMMYGGREVRHVFDAGPA